MQTLSAYSPKILSVLRLAAGLGFLHHGTSKFFGLPTFPYPLDGLLTVAGILELAGGGLLILGLFVRPVAFVLSGMMAVAYFMSHAPEGFFPSQNGGEAAMLYCFVFLYLACAGGGDWSLDSWRQKAQN